MRIIGFMPSAVLHKYVFGVMSSTRVFGTSNHVAEWSGTFESDLFRPPSGVVLFPFVNEVFGRFPSVVVA